VIGTAAGDEALYDRYILLHTLQYRLRALLVAVLSGRPRGQHVSHDPDGDATAFDRRDREPSTTVVTVLLGVAGAVLFAAGLLVTESLGEVAVDVDLKPFFLPYLLIAGARYGLQTMSVGLGAAIGEGVLDIFEGYELDDPIGFIGYVVGFLTFGWYLHNVAEDPTSARSMSVAALLGAFVQACFEAAAFLAFDAAGVRGAVVSVLGNTLTHGLLLGAIPLVVLAPVYRERIDEWTSPDP
jgi:hypothetical protein